MERFVDEWLGGLIKYDTIHGTQLVLTLSEYLDCGGNYDASAQVLAFVARRLHAVISAGGGRSRC